jgi:hypothetical protein
MGRQQVVETRVGGGVRSPSPVRVRRALIAGGSFTVAGGVAANNIASWDGGAWTGLGSGTNGGVDALAEYDNKLAVGGAFTKAGNKVSTYLAQWTRQASCCVGRVGDANNSGSDEPTVGDVSILIDAKYISVGATARFPVWLRRTSINPAGEPDLQRHLISDIAPC